MYNTYYGFSASPFELSPDPEVVYMSEAHQEALAVLRYGVVGRKGFLVLTGDVGTGKTTLLQALLHSLEMQVHRCLISNPSLTRDEFFSLLARRFDLNWEQNKALFLIEFADFLQQCTQKGERVLIIIDEAHVLNVDLLEEIRLLSNQDAAGQEALSIFLVGQPELNRLMSSKRLLPLRQRVGIRFHLKPFSREETNQYILYRLRQAGARHFALFSKEAVTLIYQVSKGTPRLINIVCDHALLSGFAKGEPAIDAALIRECVEELQFPGEENPLPVAEELSEPAAVSIKNIVLLLVLLIMLLLLVELVPITRPYSPLSAVLPENWLRMLHQLSVPVGG